MEEKFKELVSRLKEAHGGGLIAVVAHGSAVAAPANARKADYRVLVVTRALAAEDLRHARPVARWWVEEGFSLPVYFTAAELGDSVDVFSIEFAHLKRAYRVIYGEDPLAGLEVSKEHLRLKAEYELRGKFLRLRSLYLPAGDSVEGLTRLMTDSIVSFVQFMRPLLEVLGEEPPLGRRATVRRLGERLRLDTAPLERILRLRDESVPLMDIEAQELFASYLNCLARLIEAVDRL